MPTLGDDIQVLKAGILEIADIIVINKSDLPEAETYRNMLEIALSEDLDHKKIVMTAAMIGKGIEDLIKTIEDHKKMLYETGEIEKRKREMLLREIAGIIEVTIVRALMKKIEEDIIEKAPSGLYETIKEEIKKIKKILEE
ncbi:MAG: hypothetical protein DRJ64_03315 [Thermoprotei archaeon]|nr:MAG: hypothetical protein DRJ64_03315 [Thermoprotei archaeon]